MQNYVVTEASVHDSQVFDELLDQMSEEDGHKRAVYADSAYRSEAPEEKLAAAQLPSRICEKGKRDHPLTDTQKASNRAKSTVRVRLSMSSVRKRRWEGISYARLVWPARGSRSA